MLVWLSILAMVAGGSQILSSASFESASCLLQSIWFNHISLSLYRKVVAGVYTNDSIFPLVTAYMGSLKACYQLQTLDLARKLPLSREEIHEEHGFQ